MAVGDFKTRWYYYLFFVLIFCVASIMTKNSEVIGLWICYLTMAFIVFSGFLADYLFSDEQFVFDPDPNSWRRKTDPQF